MFTKRWIVTFVAVMVILSLLAACGPTPEPQVVERVVTKEVEKTVVQTVEVEKKVVETVEVEKIVEVAAVPEKKEPVELRISWWGGATRHDITVKAIKIFEELYPYIKVTYEFAGWTDYWTRMTTQAAAASLPDVMQMDSSRITEWAREGLLVPMDEYIEAGVIDVSNIAPQLLDGGRVDAKLSGFNLGNNSVGFVIDLDAFEKAGIAVPPDDWTWDDFEKIATELHAKLGIFGIGSGLTHPDLWTAIYQSHGELAWAADGKSLGYTDDQPLIDHLKMVMRLQDAGVCASRAQEVSEYLVSPETGAVVKGEAAIDFIPGSNMLIAAWAAAGPDRHFRFVNVPRPKGGQPPVPIRPSQFFSITSSSKHPEEAAMFVNFFSNSVAANAILNAERGVPVSAVVRKELESILGPAQIATFDYIARLVNDSSPLPPSDPPGAAAVNDNVWWPELVDPVCYGQTAIEEAVARFRELANKTLAEAGQ